MKEMDKKSAAKMSMLKELRNSMSKHMGEDIKGKMDGAKKVTVMADSEENLKKGLDKAKDIVEDPMEAMESPEEEIEESSEEVSENDPKELEEKIKELQAKLEALKK